MTNDLLAPSIADNASALQKSAGVVSGQLVLRNDLGQCIQQWLVKQSKCTIGSSPTCTVRCDLPGIAPHHALLVIGSKQIFLRALAPRVSRNGMPLNELLLTDDSKTFEIAGHRFEFNRELPGAAWKSADSGRPQTASAPYSAADRGRSHSPGEIRFEEMVDTSRELPKGVPFMSKPKLEKPGRIKFSLARSKELRPTPVAKVDQLTPIGNRSSNLTPEWIAQVVQSAVAPLHAKLHEMAQPIVELQQEAQRARQRRRDRSRIPRALPVFDSQSGQLRSEELKEHTQQLTESQLTIESLITQQAVRIESITERISDITCQMAAVERIVSESLNGEMTRKADTNAAGEIYAARQFESIEQLQGRLDSLAELIRQLQGQQVEMRTQQTETSSSDATWRGAIASQLASLPQTAAFDHLQAGMDSLAELIRQVQGQQAEMRSQQTELSSFDASWRGTIASQLESLPQPEAFERLQTGMDSLKELIHHVQSQQTEMQVQQTEMQVQQAEMQVQQAEFRSSDASWRGTIASQLESLPQPATFDRLQSGVESLGITLRDLQTLHDATSAADSQWRDGIGNQISELQHSTDALAQWRSQPDAQRTDASFPQWQPDASFSSYELIDRVTTPQPPQTTWIPQESAGERLQIDLGYQISEHSAPSDPEIEQPSPEQPAVEFATEFEPLARDHYPIDFSEELRSQSPQVSEASFPWLLSPSIEQPSEGFESSDPTQNNDLSSWQQTDVPLQADNHQRIESYEQSERNEQSFTSEPSFVPEQSFTPEQAFAPEQAYAPEQACALEQEYAPEQAYAEDQSSESEHIVDQQQPDRSQLPSWWTSDSETPHESSDEAFSDFHSQESYSPASSDSFQSQGEESFEQYNEMSEPSAITERDPDFQQQHFDESPAAEYDQSIDSGSRTFGTDFEFPNDDSVHGFESEESLQPYSSQPSDCTSQFSGSIDSTAEDEEDAVDAPSALNSRLDRLLAHVEPHAEKCEQFSENEYISPVASFAQPEEVEQEVVHDFPPEPKVLDNDSGMISESGDSDESVDDYMRRLLARMRGVSESEVPMPGPKSEPKKANEPTAKIGDKKTTGPVPKITEAAPPDALATQPFDPSQYVPRDMAPEKSRNLAAMRELANSSARSAIQVSARRRFGSAILLKLSISLVGFAAGGTLLLINGAAVNIALVATVAAFLVGTIWGYDALCSIKPLLAAGKQPQKAPVNEEVAPDIKAKPTESAGE